jgi:uncharacterized membrane protein YidH (DUF202 family)
MVGIYKLKRTLGALLILKGVYIILAGGNRWLFLFWNIVSMHKEEYLSYFSAAGAE